MPSERRVGASSSMPAWREVRLRSSSRRSSLGDEKRSPVKRDEPVRRGEPATEGRRDDPSVRRGEPGMEVRRDDPFDQPPVPRDEPPPDPLSDAGVFLEPAVLLSPEVPVALVHPESAVRLPPQAWAAVAQHLYPWPWPQAWSGRGVEV